MKSETEIGKKRILTEGSLTEGSLTERFGKLTVYASIVIISISLGLLGWYMYYRDWSASKKEAESDLKAIAELKSNQIAEWYKERLDEVEIRSVSPYLPAAIEKLISNRSLTERALTEPNNKIDRDKINNLLRTHKRLSHFDDVMLSAINGEVLAATSTEIKHFDSTLLDKIKRTVKNSSLQITDLYYNTFREKIELAFLAPIFNSKSEVIAVMIFRIDPEHFLYPFLQEWLPSIKSFETLLVRKHSDGQLTDGQLTDSVIYLNELKERRNSALKLTFPLFRKDLPAVQAVLGHVGIYEGIDYRGVAVLSYCTHVRGTKWYLVTKIDSDELYSDLRVRTAGIVVLTLLLIALSVVVLSYIYMNRQKNIYRELWRAEEEFKITLYSIGDAVIITDKSGLVKYINPQAEELTGWKESEAKGQAVEDVFNIVNEETGWSLTGRSLTGIKIDNPVEKVLREGLVIGIANHTLLISKDGRETPIADSGAPIRNEEGEIVGVVLVFRDQTEERAAQSALLKETVYLESLFSGSPGAVAVLDSDRFVTRINSKFTELFGYEYHEAVGKHIIELIVPDDLEEESKYLCSPAGLKELKGREKESIRCHKDGTLIEVAIIGSEIAVDSELTIDNSVNDGSVNDGSQLTIKDKDLSRIGGVYAIYIDIRGRKEAERINREREEFIKTVLENLPVGIAVNSVVPDVRFTYMNDNFLKFYGTTREELNEPGKFWEAVYEDEEFREYIKKRVTEDCASGDLERMYWQDIPVRKKGKKTKYISARNIPKPDGNAMISTVWDVTERNEQEELLRESQEKYKRLIEQTRDGIIQVDNDDVIEFVNPRFCELLGYKESELLGKIGFNTIIFEEDIELIKEKNRSRRTGKEEQYELRMKKKDGSAIHFIMSASPIRSLTERSLTEVNHDGEVIGSMSICTDITERISSELALKQASINWQTTFDAITDIVMLLKPNHEVIDINQTALVSMGIRREDIIGKKCFNFVHHCEFPIKECPCEQSLNNKSKCVNEYTVSERTYELSAFPVFDEYNEIKAFTHIVKDITERKKAEQAIKESEEKYRNLVEVSPDGIIIHQKGIIKFANKSAVYIVGYDEIDEIIGKNAIEFVHPDFRTIAIQRIQEATKENVPAPTLEEKFIKKDGSVIDVEVTAIPFTLGTEIAVQTIVRDISYRKQKEAELFETKDILEKIYLGMKDGIIVIDSKSKNITGCNFAAEKIFGFKFEEFLNQHISLIFKDKEQIKFKNIKQRSLTEKYSADVELSTETGILKRNGDILFPASYLVFPLFDKESNIIRYVLIVRDISDEISREQERKLTHQRLKSYATHLQNVREDERTSIAREIHDEIGQALSVMNMNLTLLERDYLHDSQKFNIDEIKNEIVLMKEFIMKTVGRMRKMIMNLRPEVIEDLSIIEAIDWLINEFQKDNSIICEYEKKVETIHLTDEKNISLFRIVQESLRNITRHSDASKVKIKIEQITAGFELIIDDNGKGFDLNKVNYKKSFGLTGIKERAAVLDGKVEILSEIGKGTKIVVNFH